MLAFPWLSLTICGHPHQLPHHKPPHLRAWSGEKGTVHVTSEVREIWLPLVHVKIVEKCGVGPLRDADDIRGATCGLLLHKTLDDVEVGQGVERLESGGRGETKR